MSDSTRRQFFGLLVGGLVASAAVRSWPFRIYSFPAEVSIYHPNVLTIGMITSESLKVLIQELRMSQMARWELEREVRTEAIEGQLIRYRTLK